VLKYLPVSEEDVNVDWGMNWRSDPSIHNCNISYALGLALMSSCSSPLSTLISSVWSLKEIGAQNHLLLWGNKSLFGRLRPRLKTLSDGVEYRSSRQRIDVDAGPRVGALLGLTLQLALA
jgi:hypothetical protein